MNRCAKKVTVFAFALLSLLGAVGAAAAVLVQSTPDDGLQPRLTVDQQGGIHLLYFKKRLDRPDAREGNLYYRQYLADEDRFSLPVKVSSQAYNLQTVSISRASIAVDAAGRVHVIWYLPRSFEYFYSRSNTERNQFTPQQSMVSEYAIGLDAGADIAALDNRVAIAWGAGDLSREFERTVFVRLSNDAGESFQPEMPVGNPDLGACACCSLATDFLNQDELFVAYRSAVNGVGRHTQLLTLSIENNEISGSSYAEVSKLQQWELSSCPLSTNDIGIDNNANRWLVFETAARIVQKNLQSEEAPTLVAEPLSATRQKNPAIAFNSAGEHLVVWGEGISHSRGGSLNMRLFGADGQVLDSNFTAEIEIPEFSFPAVANLPNGDFLLLY